MKKLTSVLFFILSINLIFSQDISSPKPFLSAYDESTDQWVVLSPYDTLTFGCGVESFQIKANWTEIGSPDSYRIETIPYRPKGYLPTNGTHVYTPSELGVPGEMISDMPDDRWSSIQSLSSNGTDLDICFFGNSNNQFVISPNGIISFDTSYANNFSDWNLQNMGKIAPNANCGDNKNAILQISDTNPQDPNALFDSYSFWAINGQNKEHFLLMGTHHMPMYACGGDYGYATYQVILYETTNIIEFHIQDKPLCDIWNNGYAAMGIQNADLTEGYAFPGRDNLEPYQILDLNDGFMDSNINTDYPVLPPESWRLIPDGVNSIPQEFGWYINWDDITNTGILITNDDILNMTVDNVDFNATYTAVLKYTDFCSGEEYFTTNEVNFNNNEIPAPTGDPIIDMCEAANSTLADLPVFNTTGFDGIYWFSSADQLSGTELPLETTLINGNTYYAFQGIGDCSVPLAVTIHLIDDVPAPNGENSQVFFTEDNPTLNNILVFNIPSFDQIYWYSNTFCQSGEILSPTTPLVNGETYYAYQAMDNGCCPSYLAVTVELISTTDDGDNDTIINLDEGLTNDTDGDNILDYLDTDDDGDNVPTDIEAVVTNRNTTDYLDTDGDLIPNYLDNDDDGDGILTIDEDYNGNGNPVDDDTNSDGIPDYLQSTVALNVNSTTINLFAVYPNPVKDILNLDFKNTNDKVSITIYNTYGSLVYKNDFFNKEHVAVDISELNSGIYFISSKIGKAINTIKFIKE